MKKKYILLLITIIIAALTMSVFAGGYTDVSSGDWFYSDVSEMSALGYLNGYPDGSFMPNADISAAEFTAVAARIKGIGESSAQNSHWAGGLMQTALDLGWYDWDEIPPTAETYDEPITRQLAVKILMKAFAPDARGDYNTESAKISDFSQLSGRYYEPVLAAYSLGLAKGDDNGCFCPLSPLTRAEACALLHRAMNAVGIETDTAADAKTEETAAPTSVPNTSASGGISGGGVSRNGALSVIGTELKNQNGETIVLRGMSSHGIQWFPQYADRDAIRAVSERGANLFRIAMYTEEGGYIDDPSIKEKVYAAADAASALDMYVIIDWHILSDGDPNTHIDEAKQFFAEAAERYKDDPAVIFEICNEPNGSVTWEGDVKPYAEEIISVIRSAGSNAVILVGSPTWSQDLHEVAKSPLSGEYAENIMYTCHFYAGTHTSWLRDRISSVLAEGLPVFVSEWGTSDSSGSGGVYKEETERWLEFMDTNNISNANWSLCDKSESSAALLPGADLSDGLSDDELSESGKPVFDYFLQHK